MPDTSNLGRYRSECDGDGGVQLSVNEFGAPSEWGVVVGRRLFRRRYGLYSSKYVVALRGWPWKRGGADVNGCALGSNRREITAIGSKECPKSFGWRYTAAPLDWLFQLFRTYELADPAMFREDADGRAFLVEISDAITAADALSRHDDDAALADCGAAPEPPPPVDVDSLGR